MNQNSIKKLIKVNHGWVLMVDNIMHATYENAPYARLSKKNCEAIERGYDLNELFNEVDESIDYHEFDFTSFRLGFQKALELIGDKKFTEEDMFRMFTYGHALTNAIKLKAIEDKPFGDIFNDFIQSLQQTEWDVEIEMEIVQSFKDKMGNIRTEKSIPKLDADGCLILKLKSEQNEK